MQWEQWKNKWLEEERHAFAGWDFSHLENRWQHEPLAWDYRAIVGENLRPADRLLDMGTGGGEFLLTLGHPYENTTVTEAWPPNIRLCRSRLAPLGIEVCPMEGDRLPLDENRFDIVINRHEAYDLQEVRRVLKPGGLFITQQVGGQNCLDLAARINSRMPAYPRFSLETELPKFRGCGFALRDARESFTEVKFLDVGAIVFWARIIEWTFPGFSVENNFPQLCALQNELEQKGCITSREHRFIIVAENEK